MGWVIYTKSKTYELTPQKDTQDYMLLLWVKKTMEVRVKNVTFRGWKPRKDSDRIPMTVKSIYYEEYTDSGTGTTAPVRDSCITFVNEYYETTISYFPWRTTDAFTISTEQEIMTVRYEPDIEPDDNKKKKRKKKEGEGKGLFWKAFNEGVQSEEVQSEGKQSGGEVKTDKKGPVKLRV